MTTTLDLQYLATATEAELAEKAKQSPEWFAEVNRQFAHLLTEDVKACQIAYYSVANPMAMPAHLSVARQLSLLGGNRSAKTTTALAELAIRVSGHIPRSLWETYPLEKIRGPIRTRIVCNSLTDTLEPVIKPKLNPEMWNGVGDPKDGRGHWGFIPQHCLVGGTWEKAYSEKYRTLRVAFCTLCTILPHTESQCRGCAAGMPRTKTGHAWPRNWTNVSTVQMLSYDQDLTAFAGSSMHLVIHDELPPADIYRENRMRTLDVKGQIITAFTPPDEIGMARGDVTWFYDEVYEPGLPGPDKHPSVDTYVLHTEQNSILSSADINEIARTLTEAQREVRLFGKFIHLSGVIYPIFTNRDSWWCARCAKRILPVNGKCLTCRGDDVVTFAHVIEPFPIPKSWPVLFVIDPHPRKKDAMGWFAVTPGDDIIMVAELETDGTAGDVARAMREFEESKQLAPIKRLMDPNMATETNDKLQRGWTLRKGYDEVGIRCDLANDEMNTGIQTVSDLLKPDAFTKRPRLTFFSDCRNTIHAMSRWSWDEYTRQGDREPKERPRDRFKDFCDVVRYAAMDHPTFHGYRMRGAVTRREHGRTARGY